MVQAGRPGMREVQKSGRCQRWRNAESIFDVSNALAAELKALTLLLMKKYMATPAI